MHERNLSFSGWSLVTEKAECYGSEIYKGEYSDIGSCSDACKGLASHFIFQRSEYCSHGLCKCLCEPMTNITCNSDGSCNEISNKYFDLYEYKGKCGF